MREKITWPGARIKKKDEGMPNYDNNNAKGDLYITFDVEFPRGGLEDSEKEGMSHLIFWGYYVRKVCIYILLLS